MPEEKKQISLRERYLHLLDSLPAAKGIDKELIADLFEECQMGKKALGEANPLIADFGVNPLQLTLYIINEHRFYLALNPQKDPEELKTDPHYHSLICSVALDKYFTNERLAYQMGTFSSRYNPTVSTIDVFLNFTLGILSRYKKREPSETLLVDIMLTGFQMAKCCSTLLEEGFETQAFSAWRTLHENECILQVVVKYGKPIIDRYLRHMVYGQAFRGAYPKEETDKIFVEIKDGMHEIGLKSKDMKRFIEYGWLLGVPDVMKTEGFKFNFRDGVQRIAGLTRYSKTYEMSSEIAHSSPVLIYSRKDYFHHFTLLNLYESFFRLEKIFASLYLSTVDKAQQESYIRMRNLYFNELLGAYRMEQQALAKITKKG